MTGTVPTPSRRQVVLGSLGVLFLAGCTDAASSGSAATSLATSPTTTSPSATGSMSSSSASTVASPSSAASASALPAARAWTARAGEVEPQVKRVATTLVEAVGTWQVPGGGSSAAARRRASALGVDPAVVASLSSLLGDEPAAVAIVRDAQYGGILTSSASVLVVVDQWREVGGRAQPGGTTLDVRLVRASSGWRVTAIHPAQPGPAIASLTTQARDVLSSERIHLPYAAAADVRSGRVHDTVLVMLLGLAQEHVVDVSVVRSGHPIFVFGTSRRSAHPLGRAVDVWALDGKPLVLPGNEGLAAQGMRTAVSLGANNVGGPVLLPGPEYFSDNTHQDHIHLGMPT